MVEKISVAELMNLALSLSDEELRQAVEFLNQEYRERFTRAARVAALALKVGDWVEVTHESRKLQAGLRGHVMKIRRDRVDVHFPDQEGYWTLTATMVRKVDGPPDKKPAP